MSEIFAAVLARTSAQVTVGSTRRLSSSLISFSEKPSSLAA